MHIGAYSAQLQGYGYPLQLFMSRKVRKEDKGSPGLYMESFDEVVQVDANYLGYWIGN